MRFVLAASFLLAALRAGPAHADVAPPPAPPAPPPVPTVVADAEDHKVEVKIDTGSSRDALDIINDLPPDVRANLDGDQINDIIRREQDNRSRGMDATEIVVPGFFFATIVGIVVVLQVSRFRRERQLHETLRMMIEKGVEIPPALIVPEKPKPNDRRRGTILIMLGTGLAGFLASVEDDGSWALGLVPIFLGAGYLAAWFLEKRDPTSFDA